MDKIINFILSHKIKLISIIIVIIIMYLLGFLIYIVEKNNFEEQIEIYDSALKVTDTNSFQKALDYENNKYILASGKMKAIDTVTFPELNDEYLYIRKITYEYQTFHKVVSTGKTTYRRTYHRWVEINVENKKASQISFLDIPFENNKFSSLPSIEYITTITDLNNSNIKYEYYGLKKEYIGTIIAYITDHNISNNIKFFNNRTIEKIIENVHDDSYIIITILMWILLTILIIFLICLY